MFYLLIAHVRAYQEVKNLVFRKILCTYEMNHPYVYFMLAKNLTITLKVIFKILLERLSALISVFYHCVECVQIRSYFWSVFSCIRTRNNSVFGYFSQSVFLTTNFQIVDRIFQITLSSNWEASNADIVN